MYGEDRDCRDCSDQHYTTISFHSQHLISSNRLLFPVVGDFRVDLGLEELVRDPAQGRGGSLRDGSLGRLGVEGLIGLAEADACVHDPDEGVGKIACVI